jgi:hypothetical protein
MPIYRVSSQEESKEKDKDSMSEDGNSTKSSFASSSISQGRSSILEFESIFTSEGLGEVSLAY